MIAEFWRSPLHPQLEARRSCQENTCYRPHTHDRFSIGLIDSGSSSFTPPSGDPVRLFPGDVVLIPAGLAHACNPDRGRWRYRMVHADQGWLAGLPTGAPGAIVEKVAIIRNRTVHRLTGAAIDLLFAGGDRRAIEGAFGHALSAAATVGSEPIAGPDVDPALIERLNPALHRLRHDVHNPALDELADLVGMSKFQLIRAMKRATGLSPLAWRHSERVTMARAMLRHGYSLADTAHELGFVDQSHLHRIFRAHVAAAPGAYRQ